MGCVASVPDESPSAAPSSSTPLSSPTLHRAPAAPLPHRHRSGQQQHRPASPTDPNIPLLSSPHSAPSAPVDAPVDPHTVFPAENAPHAHLLPSVPLMSSGAHGTTDVDPTSVSKAVDIAAPATDTDTTTTPTTPSSPTPATLTSSITTTADHVQQDREMDSDHRTLQKSASASTRGTENEQQQQSTSSKLTLSPSQVPVQARIAKFNEMDDVAVTLGSSSHSATAVTNGGTPNSTLSSIAMSTSTSAPALHDDVASNSTNGGPSSRASLIVRPGSMPAQNAIYERIVDFERQAEETERLKSSVHKPKQNFKEEIQVHKLERPRVFSSSPVATT